MQILQNAESISKTLESYLAEWRERVKAQLNAYQDDNALVLLNEYPLPEESLGIYDQDSSEMVEVKPTRERKSSSEPTTKPASSKPSKTSSKKASSTQKEKPKAKEETSKRVQKTTQRKEASTKKRAPTKRKESSGKRQVVNLKAEEHRTKKKIEAMARRKTNRPDNVEIETTDVAETGMSPGSTP